MTSPVQINDLFSNYWHDELQTQSMRPYRSIELFAGAGGLALGLEKAGFKAILLNEFDKHACATLRHNRPEWHVVEDSIVNVDFREYQGQIDFLSGGFPCQAFSYAGNKQGFDDTRGHCFLSLPEPSTKLSRKFF